MLLKEEMIDLTAIDHEVYWRFSSHWFTQNIKADMRDYQSMARTTRAASWSPEFHRVEPTSAANIVKCRIQLYTEHGADNHHAVY